MCIDNQEPGEELDGQHLAEQLAEHLASMGASNAKFEALVNDEKYEISVKHVPVEPEAP